MWNSIFRTKISYLKRNKHPYEVFTLDLQSKMLKDNEMIFIFTEKLYQFSDFEITPTYQTIQFYQIV